MAKLKYYDGQTWKQLAPSKEEFDDLQEDFDAHKADDMIHRNIHIVPEDPSDTDGEDGDLFFVYE